MAEFTIKGLDTANLWDVTTVTDLLNGEILCHAPINAEGDYDIARVPFFKGRTNIQLQGPGRTMQVPLVFDLPGPALPDAIAGFVEALTKAINEFESNMHRQRILEGAGMPRKQ